MANKNERAKMRARFFGFFRLFASLGFVFFYFSSLLFFELLLQLLQNLCRCCGSHFPLAWPLRWAATKDIAKLILCTAATSTAAAATQKLSSEMAGKTLRQQRDMENVFARLQRVKRGVPLPQSSWGLGPPLFWALGPGVGCRFPQISLRFFIVAADDWR